VAMMPELKLGVAVLTNQESGAAFDSIVFRVLDVYLNVPAEPTDWILAYERIEKRARDQAVAATTSAAAARDAASKPSLPLDRYAGRYRDAWYGDLTIARKGDGLTIAFEKTPSLTGALAHWPHAT